MNFTYLKAVPYGDHLRDTISQTVDIWHLDSPLPRGDQAGHWVMYVSPLRCFDDVL